MDNKNLKYLLIVAILVWIVTAYESSFAQTEAGLEGNWVNELSTRKAEFYRQDNAWFGKLTWVKEDSKARVGDLVFRDLVWNGKQFKGQATTPKGVVNCVVVFEGADKIRITASKGGFSKSVYWSRLK